MNNKTLLTLKVSSGQLLHVVHGDLTLEVVDAIVNAANRSLSHGGGVAGAIVRRGGKVIQIESNDWVTAYGPVPTGSAIITGAGDLPARYVIHAVGPVWKGQGDEPDLLRAAVQSSLSLAEEHGLKNVSFPAISSGIFGFPKPLAATVIWEAVLDYLDASPYSTLQEIRFCNIDRLTVDLFYQEGLKRGGIPL